MSHVEANYSFFSIIRRASHAFESGSDPRRICNNRVKPAQLNWVVVQWNAENARKGYQREQNAESEREADE